MSYKNLTTFEISDKYFDDLCEIVDELKLVLFPVLNGKDFGLASNALSIVFSEIMARYSESPVFAKEFSESFYRNTILLMEEKGKLVK